MSEKYREIIRSGEAEAFLRMVTKGFYDNSYTGLWIYEVIGREWDDMRTWAEGLKNEINPQTCTWSVGIWEWVYGVETDESLALELRRQRILAKIIGTKPINPEVIRRGVAALAGIPRLNVGVRDFTGPYSFAVDMRPTRGMIPYGRIAAYLYRIKPAHLHTDIYVSVEAQKPFTLYMGGRVGTDAELGMHEKPDDPHYQDTLHAGGRVGADGTLALHERPDTPDFRRALHAGGNFGAARKQPIPQNQNERAAATILRTGGVTTILSNISKGD